MDKKIWKIILPLLLSAIVLALAMPRGEKFNYEYRSGMEWPYTTLFAQFDFPILKTDAQMDAEREKLTLSVTPYFNKIDEPLRNAAGVIESLNLGVLKADVLELLNEIYDKGVVSDGVYTRTLDTPNPEICYVQSHKRASKHPAREVYSLSAARQSLAFNVKKLHPNINVDSVFIANSVYEVIVPNLIYDSETTDLIHKEKGGKISGTSGYVDAGQVIVSNGEMITPDICLILDSYAKEFENQRGGTSFRWTVFAGNLLIAIVIVVILGLSIYFTARPVFYDRRYAYILMIFVIFSLATLMVRKTGDNLLYMFPFPLAALYLEAFFRPKITIPVYLVILLPLLVFSYAGVGLYVMFALSGLVSIYCIRIMNKGWHQFLIALITFACNIAVFTAFNVTGILHGSYYRFFTYLLISSIGMVAGYPFIYLLEKIFNFTSTSRLVELCDTSNKLIQSLEQKAPGTFQHSLQVMNMADAVARSIDANPQLVRAGALYHDVGKILNPQCFVENESLIVKEEAGKYHAGKTPLESAKDIIRHMEDGVGLAEENRLPNDIVDFIKSHHGTSRVAYFYSKYLEQGGSPENEAEFRYPGVKPKTKEQVILMLCDNVEAAARTLKDYSPETFSDCVEKIVDGKMSEGQFDDSSITIHELGLVKSELKQYLSQMYHDRIEYPTLKTKK